MDGSISRAIQDINEHKRQEVSGEAALPALSRSHSYNSDSYDISPKTRSAHQRGASAKASLLSANRKTITNFQSILVSANSSSHDDLQLLAGSMENITVSDAPSPAEGAEGDVLGSSAAPPLPAEDEQTQERQTQRVYASAKKLLDAGTIDHKEFNHLIMSDCKVCLLSLSFSASLANASPSAHPPTSTRHVSAVRPSLFCRPPVAFLPSARHSSAWK